MRKGRREIAARIWIIIIGSAITASLALVSRSRPLLSAWSNNVGSLLLIPEWHNTAVSTASYRCQMWIGASQAQPWIAQALSRDVTNQRAWVNAGRVHWLVKECDRATEAWKRAYELRPADTLTLFYVLSAAPDPPMWPSATLREQAGQYAYFRGCMAHSRGAFQAAIDWYALSFSLDATWLTAVPLTSLHLRLGHIADATEIWQVVADSTTTDDPDHWWAVGQIAQLNEDWDIALDAYRHGVQITSDPASFYQQMARVFERGKADIESADRYYEMAVQANPKMVTAYLGAGHMHLGRNEYDMALSWYRRAASASPDPEAVYAFQGAALCGQGHLDRARARFTEALSARPKDADVWYWFALCEYRAGQIEAALQYLEQAVELDNKPTPYWAQQLAEWYSKAGRCRQIDLLYEQMQTRRPSDAQTLERLQAMRDTCR